MRKKGVFLFMLILFANIPFLAAAYQGFTFEDIKSVLDQSIVFLGATFILIFLASNYLLLKLFKESKESAAAIAFAIAFPIIYGINKSGFDHGSIFNYLGYSEGLAFTIISILVLIGIIYALFKVGFSTFLLIIGIILAGVSFTDLVYEGGIILIIGITCFIIGGWLWLRKRRGNRERGTPGRGINIGTILKILIFAAAIYLTQVNLLLALIVLVILLLVLFFTRQKNSTQPPVQKGPGFWSNQWQKERDVMSARKQRFRNWREQRRIRKAGMDTGPRKIKPEKPKKIAKSKLKLEGQGGWFKKTTKR